MTGLRPISKTDLAPSFMDEHHTLMQQMALDYQWDLLVQLTGSEDCAATVVGRTPFMGVPRRARESFRVSTRLRVASSKYDVRGGS